MKIHGKRLSRVSLLHYFRLVYRGILLLVGTGSYLSIRLNADEPVLRELPQRPAVLAVIWVVFTLEMLMRFFPSNLESPGCQKQFTRNYIKTGETEIRIPDNNATVLVALLWITLNGAIGALKMADILDDGIMILICLVYSVCDMICILFFCPFQTWFLKNKCCASCRIYNWDYAMMFTPLFFVRGWYSWSLLIMAVALLLRWEIAVYRHPERFSEKTNGYLACANCTEKLCRHKTQLQTLWKDISEFTRRRVERLKKDENRT